MRKNLSLWNCVIAVGILAGLWTSVRFGFMSTKTGLVLLGLAVLSVILFGARVLWEWMIRD